MVEQKAPPNTDIDKSLTELFHEEQTVYTAIKLPGPPERAVLVERKVRKVFEHSLLLYGAPTNVLRKRHPFMHPYEDKDGIPANSARISVFTDLFSALEYALRIELTILVDIAKLKLATIKRSSVVAQSMIAVRDKKTPEMLPQIMHKFIQQGALVTYNPPPEEKTAGPFDGYVRYIRDDGIHVVSSVDSVVGQERHYVECPAAFLTKRKKP